MKRFQQDEEPPRLRPCSIIVSHTCLPHLPSWKLSVESVCTCHLNADHGDPITLPPAASTLTPSPLSSRTFSPLCLPVIPPVEKTRVSVASSKQEPSNKTSRLGGGGGGVKSFWLPEHVWQLERSEIGGTGSEMYIHSPPNPPMPPSAATTR